MHQQPASTQRLPGEHLDPARMPAYWVLARTGKRVLRPGGRKLTESVLSALGIGSQDHVIELAPGLGATTRLILRSRPAAYTGIERDGDAADIVNAMLTEDGHACLVGKAQGTGLEDGAADVVVGEAFLSMQPDPAKRAIVSEAFRLLQPGGRYGLHELALQPDSLDQDIQERVRADLAETLRVGARPLTIAGWRSILEGAGFRIEQVKTAPMALFRPQRVIQDEGLLRSVRIVGNVLRDPVVRDRVRKMRAHFRRHGQHLCAVAIVARKA